jgi:hypothetical protein
MEIQNELFVPDFRGSMATIRSGEKRVPKKAIKAGGDSWEE